MSEASKERDFTLKLLEILFFQYDLSSHEFMYSSNDNYYKSSNYLTCPVSTENEGRAHSLKRSTF